MDTPTTFSDLVNLIVGIINDGLVFLLLAALFIFVVWKIIDTFIINAADESKRSSGKKTILAAVIFLVVFSSLWGIVTLLRTSIFG